MCIKCYSYRSVARIKRFLNYCMDRLDNPEYSRCITQIGLVELEMRNQDFEDGQFLHANYDQPFLGIFNKSMGDGI